MNNNNITRNFYNNTYKQLGFTAQRIYPNEELCRFMGRNFFHLPVEQRKDIKILETGCGSGANLWMIAREGFDAYGIDLSHEALSLCEKMLSKYGTKATVQQQDMMNLEYLENYFDGIVDVFSSYCLNKQQGKIYLEEVFRTLKPGGFFFSYFPSKRSDSFQFLGTSELIDSDTLNSILRLDSPFYGQEYPFRFMHPREYDELLQEVGFNVKYLEVVTRTYQKRQEEFEFVVVEARKS